jgi:hypothetical protein
MSADLVLLERLVGTALTQLSRPTPGIIRERIEEIAGMSMVGATTAEDREALARRLEARFDVTMTLGTVLEADNFDQWYDQARVDIDPRYWERYRTHLAHKGFPPDVVDTMDRDTDNVVRQLGDPGEEGHWDRRGMVVGHVQSGKTANYAGVIAKAADAGYRLIVVIAGLHNNLRNQTQRRLEEDFVGRATGQEGIDQRGEAIGVGRIDPEVSVVTLTNATSDFNVQAATAVGVALDDLNAPALLVIKKNTHTLKNLLSWLRAYSARLGTEKVRAPMLLIDDEADNASINIRSQKDDISRINGQIRELLDVFEHSSYVGYTATPFANIFIDPDSDDEMVGADLFPRDFIVTLNAPSNYFGPVDVFIERPREHIRTIEDHYDVLPTRHKIDHVLPALPPTLIRAVRAFALSRAIRLFRGETTAHMSMLVNVSRFVRVQGIVAGLVHRHLREIQAAIRTHGSLDWPTARKDPELAELHAVWEEEYGGLEHDWREIFPLLSDAALPITVEEVNSRAPGRLDYREYDGAGLSVIAVGGFSLSRGLTLEGLTVSYFLRNSMMYDTLMQMGRWFGYRPNYEDLCRIWMPEEAEAWYEHISESTELLRDEMRAMERANATPSDFGLKVRSHADSLLVTARNKMGSGQAVTMSIGLANEFVETAILRRDDPSLQANRRAAKALAERIDDLQMPSAEAEGLGTGHLFRGVPASLILPFLSAFRNHEGSTLTAGDPVRRYIEARVDDELAEWDVLFPSIGATKDTTTWKAGGLTIRCQRRAYGLRSNRDTLYITNKQRVASRGIEQVGLKSSDIKKAQDNFRAEHPDRKNVPDYVYRPYRPAPLLIVHALRVDHPVKEGDTIRRPDEQHQDPVIAWSISFPSTELEEKTVKYVVNPRWLREQFGSEIDDDEGLDGEEL